MMSMYHHFLFFLQKNNNFRQTLNARLQTAWMEV